MVSKPLGLFPRSVRSPEPPSPACSVRLPNLIVACPPSSPFDDGTRTRGQEALPGNHLCALFTFAAHAIVMISSHSDSECNEATAPVNTVLGCTTLQDNLLRDTHSAYVGIGSPWDCMYTLLQLGAFTVRWL